MLLLPDLYILINKDQHKYSTIKQKKECGLFFFFFFLCDHENMSLVQQEHVIYTQTAMK